MRFPVVVLATILLLAHVAPAQQLSPTDKAMLTTLRARFYNLQTAGFSGMTCAVHYDFATVPLLSSNPLDPVRTLLQRSKITLGVDNNGRPNVELHYPAGASPADTNQATQVAGLLRAFVSGVFQTWPSKGFMGPIPPFDSQVASVTSTDDGHTVTMRPPIGADKVLLDNTGNVTEILSAQGKLKEHPQYTPSPEGLVFTGNDATDETGSQRNDIHYELGIGIIDGLRIPVSVRLKVNGTIDVRYSLEACELSKALVIKVSPPN